MRIFTIIAALILIALPLAAQPNDVARCNLAGTWYGGSSAEVPYLMSVSAGHGGRYTIEFQLVLSPPDIGYKMWTSWTGEAVKTGPGEFENWTVSYWLMMHEYAVENGLDDSKPELDMVHGVLRFVDCDTLTNEIDLLNAFFAFDPAVDTPFAPPYDYEGLPPGASFVETYHRMPTATTPMIGITNAAPQLDSFKVAPSRLKWWRR